MKWGIEYCWSFKNWILYQKKKKKNYLVINDKNDESNIGIFLESLESLENYEILYEKNRNDLNKILWFRNIFIVF